MTSGSKPTKPSVATVGVSKPGVSAAACATPAEASASAATTGRTSTRLAGISPLSRGPGGRAGPYSPHRLHGAPLASTAVEEVRLWTPRGAGRAKLPLLVVHDGPDYDSRAKLTAWARGAIRRGALPAFRIALLAVADRSEAYSASARYARTLAHEIVPALPIAGPPVGMGASLGALAMLHAEW